MAVRFSQRRFRYQMDPLVFLWKQTSRLPAPTDLLFVIQFQQALEPFSSILKWLSLGYGTCRSSKLYTYFWVLSL